MAFSAIVYRVLIASPSDVQREREAAEDAVRMWNSLHAESDNVALMPVRWEVDAVAEQGESGQGVLNAQLIDKCDLLVGIFWHRLGRQTKVAASGTVEEIDRFIANNRPVSLFNCSRNIPAKALKADPDQYSRLQAVIKGYEAKGIVLPFTTATNLGGKVYQMLVHRVRALTPVKPVETPAPEVGSKVTASTRRNVTVKIGPALTVIHGQTINMLAITVYNDGPRPVVINEGAVMLSNGNRYLQVIPRHLPSPVPKKIEEGETVTVYIDDVSQLRTDLIQKRLDDPDYKIIGAVALDAAGNGYFGEAPEGLTEEVIERMQ